MNYIFDLYGTLVDIRTDEQSVKFKRRFEKYLNSINAQGDFFTRYFDLCAALTGKGRQNCEIDLLSVFREIVGEENCASAALRFRKLSTERIKVYGGVKAFLNKLKERGDKLYILSNAQSCFTLQEIEKLKLTKYFDGIELSSDFGAKKPGTAFFRHMLLKYSLDVRDSIYVGNDICADIAGAQSVNLRSAYILSNLSPECDSLSQASEMASFVCDSHKKLFEYLLSI